MKKYNRRVNILNEMGKIIGEVEGDTFFKTIAPNHFLRKPPAIAFDVVSLDQAEAAGAVRVQVTDRESGTRYKASIAHVRTSGFQFNRGFGDQIGLPMAGWIKQFPGKPIQTELPF